MAIPTFIAPFRGNASMRDRNGPFTASGGGAFRGAVDAELQRYVGRFQGAVTNLVLNPSFEQGLDFWTREGVGVSATIDIPETISGNIALRVSWDGNGSLQGVATRTNSLNVAPSTSFIGTVWLKGASGTTLGLRLSDNKGGVSSRTVELSGSWQRAEISHRTSSIPPVELILRIDNTPSPTSPTVFWVDAVQIQQGTVASDYFDGDHEGASWTGLPNRSTSVREGGYLTVPRTRHLLNPEQGEVLIRYRQVEGSKGGLLFATNDIPNTTGTYFTSIRTQLNGDVTISHRKEVSSSTFTVELVEAVGEVVALSLAWDGNFYWIRTAGGTFKHVPIRPNREGLPFGERMFIGGYGPNETNIDADFYGLVGFERPLSDSERDKFFQMDDWEWGNVLPRIGGLIRVRPQEPLGLIRSTTLRDNYVTTPYGRSK